MKSDFRIHSICLVKNEADIIEYCLREALKWSDNIFIYDGQSTDGTWEKVVALSKEENRIIPWKQDGKLFQESLRAEVFNAFRHLAQEGDWWCHLDADEFYIQNPKIFLSNVSLNFHVVWAIFIQYYLTSEDLSGLDFKKSIEVLLQQLKYYKADNCEPRFFRHRSRLRWDLDDSWPKHMGIVNPEQILMKHYKYRSPQQIEQKLITRMNAIGRGFQGWEYIKKYHSWRDVIRSDEDLEIDNNDGKFKIDKRLQHQHIESEPKRIIKRVFHGLGILP